MNIGPRIPRSKPCAFCTFKASPWLASTSLLRWQDGSIRYRHATPSQKREQRERLARGNHAGTRLDTGDLVSRLEAGDPNAEQVSRKGTRIDTTDVRSALGRDPTQSGKRDPSGSGLTQSYRPLKKGPSVTSKESAYDILANLVYEQTKKFISNEKRAVSIRIADKSKEEQRKTIELLDTRLADFANDVKASATRAARIRKVTIADNPLFFHFRQAFITGHINGLYAEVKYRYLNSVHGKTSKASQATAEFQAALADLSHPTEWFPGTRAMQRTVHLHIGPTNSGKTYHALKRLEAAKTGVYAGPLRLLAHEVYSRFNAMGKKCALITGEEQRVPEGLNHAMSSCTVEMVPLNTLVDVAVIDEIQMIGDFSRGWAWTQAFLGVMAKEVHLCGEERTEEIITSLCQTTGDKLVIHRYKRLGVLEVERKSFHDRTKGATGLSNLQKGDAVILFSRMAIHGMKKAIETATGRRCAVVYGSLPPETRAQQAALFNDPNNDYDFLAASNAVGMGLNLSIKRIIFEGITRFNGVAQTRLETSEIKQIAGRAGRFKTAQDAIVKGKPTNYDANSALPSTPEVSPTGFVTAWNQGDLRAIETAMRTEVPQIKTAGIAPPEHITSKFASFFSPDTPFTYIMLRMKELIKTNSQYHMCDIREAIEILDVLQPYPMTIKDRLTLVNAPLSVNEPGVLTTINELASCISNQNSGALLDIRSLNLEIIDQDILSYPGGALGYLRNAELLHKGLTLYLWLSYRFSAVFRSQALAFHVKGLVEEKIDFCLSQVQGRKETRAARRNAKLDIEFERLQELENSDLLRESIEEDQLDVVTPLESRDDLDLARGLMTSSETILEISRAEGTPP